MSWQGEDVFSSLKPGAVSDKLWVEAARPTNLQQGSGRRTPPCRGSHMMTTVAR